MKKKLTAKDVEDFKLWVNDSESANHLNYYQELAARTGAYPGEGYPIGLFYVSLKLAGEAGEFTEKVGKAIRDDNIVTFSESKDETTGMAIMRRNALALDLERLDSLKKELSDILWYVAKAAGELGYTLSEIAEANLEKVSRRQTEGKTHGSGDDR